MFPVSQRRLPALRLRLPRGDRAERVASVALACFITASTALLAIAAPARFTHMAPTPSRSASEVAEHVLYVGARVVSPPVVAARQPAPSSTSIAPVDTAAVRDDVPSIDQSQASSTPPAVVSPTEPAALAVVPPTPSTVGAPADGLTVGFSTRVRRQIRYDSALGDVHDKLAATIARGERRALTQAERDEQMRAAALGTVAGRGAGTPKASGAIAGGGIGIPLPFGGPSNAQRKRDRQAYEETKKIMARVQRRADSVIAARRRRFADSLAQVADSQVRHARPR